MRQWRQLAFGGSMLVLGYVLGTAGLFQPASLTAQDFGDGLSEDTENRIRAAHRAVREAVEALQSEGRYEAITQGTNSFLALSGGGNAREDLEQGRGVDPETFAALYAGLATPEVAELLEIDEEGRITYNDQVVRMYSRSRLQRSYSERLKYFETSL
ncbi:hypothetical protein Mal4_26400 [Maioricimonas rarisocia]|uniref:Uncharacterized protein n=1 Tax=Maioricimonas rarisocia TaxID=2528026 RepID=A0A517Z765_9PLAN|nr:hypothetical protein [Maioricimonas rarisocia]QDU38313.1 hypothetical protein Mal4_26400 [Maioricimonas rarisocia]